MHCKLCATGSAWTWVCTKRSGQLLLASCVRPCPPCHPCVALPLFPHVAVGKRKMSRYRFFPAVHVVKAWITGHDICVCVCMRWSASLYRPLCFLHFRCLSWFVLIQKWHFKLLSNFRFSLKRQLLAILCSNSLRGCLCKTHLASLMITCPRFMSSESRFRTVLFWERNERSGGRRWEWRGKRGASTALFAGPSATHRHVTKSNCHPWGGTHPAGISMGQCGSEDSGPHQPVWANVLSQRTYAGGFKICRFVHPKETHEIHAWSKRHYIGIVCYFGVNMLIFFLAQN